MDTETVFTSTLLVVLLFLIVFTWKRYPYAKYIVLARTDKDPKYIAVQSIEVIDNKGGRREIVGLEGSGQLVSGFSNTVAAKAAAGLSTSGIDVTFNGKTMGYFKDSGVAAGADPVIGPIIAVLPSNQTETGYMMFSLGCPAKIARLNIKSADDTRSQLNMQRIKVYLLDKDKQIINGAEQFIPSSSSAIPPAVHHISFV